MDVFITVIKLNGDYILILTVSQDRLEVHRGVANFV
jgi:hypothetical protein